MRSPFLGFGSEQALHHIADALADGLFTTDAQGVVTYWSPAAERITGWSSAEAVGTSCSLLAGDMHGGCSCGTGPIRCGLALSGRSSKRCTIRTKSGRILVIVKSAVPIRDAHGETIGALESFTVAGEQTDPDVHDEGDKGAARLIGEHPLMRDVHRMVRLVAASDATVMIVGESGTGKDLIAEAIHRSGPRATASLVRVQCAALRDALPLVPVNAADARRGPPEEGLLGAARGGTLVLDEIGDIEPAEQVRLLHLLERREANRARDPQAASQWFRILCTTQRDLKKMVDVGTFRADLYFRLNVFPLRAPALREHLSDLPMLADAIAARLTPPAALTPESLGPLMAYDWPGNVRELQNVIEYAALQASGGPLLPEHFPPNIRESSERQLTDERSTIVDALARSGGNRTAAAQSLGVSRVTLWKWMKKHGVE